MLKSGGLPTVAGRASLHWVDGEDVLAVRSGDVITLSKALAADFFSLADGMKFIYSLGAKCYFGGAVKAKRQGDWYAVPLPFRANELGIWNRWLMGEEIGEDTVIKTNLNGTRHLLTGVVIENVQMKDENDDSLDGTFASGTLESVDHPDLVMDTIHYLHQTDKLLDPKRAD